MKIAVAETASPEREDSVKRKAVAVPVRAGPSLPCRSARGALSTVLVAQALAGAAAAPVPWENVLDTKIELLRSAAERAVRQQRIGHLPDVPLTATFAGVGGVAAAVVGDWDADGDGRCQRVELRNIPVTREHVRVADRLEVRFPEPVNLLEKGTGFAFWVRTPEGLSPHLRVGVRFKVKGTDQDPVIFTDTPLVQRFGDNPHQLYFDWGYVFAHSTGVFEVPPKEFFERVTGFDLTFVQKTLPITDERLAAASGHFWLDGLRIVDWGDGSYDNGRFKSDRVANGEYPVVLQGRTQQVALIAAQFGGEAGIASAIRAMDMMVRTQSWDGSWPEMRTRMQGEYTHGMILADLARALRVLREARRPELEEVVAERHWRMRRDELYEQMLYRAAMSRGPGGLWEHRDSYSSGRGALSSGANRPMVFVAAQHIAAQVIHRPAWRAEILAEYEVNMPTLLKAQGMTSGGWPIFGEGDRYRGAGLHWDCGYTMDHVQIMANAARATGDPRWGEMMRKFDTVVEAMVMADGRTFDGALSERGDAKEGQMKSPDIVFQEAIKHRAPKLAQWAANSSAHVWGGFPRTGSLWPYARTARGYGLGAFLTWQVYDLEADPKPRDLGIVFPRQWPVWTARWINKAGVETRRSTLVARRGVGLVHDFAWAVGEYPVLQAVPLAVESLGGPDVELRPVAYAGDTARLPAAAALRLTVGPAAEGAAPGAPRAMDGDAAEIQCVAPSRVEIAAPEHGVQIAFDAVPQAEGEAILRVRLLRKPEPYRHHPAAP